MNVAPTLGDLQDAGFPVGGESLVALDLVDTVLLKEDPAVDLLGEPGAHARWWALQAPRLPAGPAPDLAATLRLRAAARAVFEARIDQCAPEPIALEDINSVAGSVPVSTRLVGSEHGLSAQTRWHTEHGGNAALAAIAREAVGLLGTPGRAELLRRCANPDCSMLFLAENKRRTWCAANVCGNRVRVARHYARTHRAG